MVGIDIINIQLFTALTLVRNQRMDYLFRSAVYDWLIYVISLPLIEIEKLLMYKYYLKSCNQTCLNYINMKCKDKSLWIWTLSDFY